MQIDQHNFDNVLGFMKWRSIMSSYSLLTSGACLLTQIVREHLLEAYKWQDVTLVPLPYIPDMCKPNLQKFIYMLPTFGFI